MLKGLYCSRALTAIPESHAEVVAGFRHVGVQLNCPFQTCSSRNQVTFLALNEAEQIPYLGRSRKVLRQFLKGLPCTCPVATRKQLIGLLHTSLYGRVNLGRGTPTTKGSRLLAQH